MTNLCQTRFYHNQGVAVRYNNNIYQTIIETLIKGFARGIRCKCEPVNLISSQVLRNAMLCIYCQNMFNLVYCFMA